MKPLGTRRDIDARAVRGQRLGSRGNLEARHAGGRAGIRDVVEEQETARPVQDGHNPGRFCAGPVHEGESKLWEIDEPDTARWRRDVEVCDAELRGRTRLRQIEHVKTRGIIGHIRERARREHVLRIAVGKVGGQQRGFFWIGHVEHLHAGNHVRRQDCLRIQESRSDHSSLELQTAPQRRVGRVRDIEHSKTEKVDERINQGARGDKRTDPLREREGRCRARR